MPFEVSKKADLNIRKTQKFEKKLATKYHKTSSLTPTSSKPFDKTNTCDTILEKGEWTNFKKIGSWERYNIDSNNQLSIDEQQPRNFRLDAVFYNGKIDRNKNSKILSDPKCKKPYRWPSDCTGRPNWGNGFYNWKQQSYTGDWASNDNECKLHRLSENEVGRCFSPTKSVVIGVNGDSISRQIFLATSMYLTQTTTGFFDEGVFGGVHERKIKEYLAVKFHWNETPEAGIREEPIYDDEHLSLLIVGPKCLHPMFNVFGSKSWDGKDSHPETFFEMVELPKIRKFLKKNASGFVYVVAQHHIHRNREDKVSRTYRSYDIIKQYNARVRELVLAENSDRLKHVGVAEELSFTPERDTILTPDGTHWMWKIDPRTDRGKLADLPIAPNLLGLLDVIFNHYCTYNKT